MQFLITIKLSKTWAIKRTYKYFSFNLMLHEANAIQNLWNHAIALFLPSINIFVCLAFADKQFFNINHKSSKLYKSDKEIEITMSNLIL